jgi:hypothetical protein
VGRGKKTAMVLFASLALLVTVGCQQDEISHYRVERGEVAAPLSAASRKAGFTYDLPANWTEQRAGEFRRAAFAVQEGDQKAEITVIPFPGTAGGVAMNVNRWRGQVGLGQASEEQISKELEALEVGGVKRPYVDLTGPESAGGKRILALIIEHGGQSWFVTMKGPSAIVGKQKPAFEAFARSLKFDDEKGSRS